MSSSMPIQKMSLLTPELKMELLFISFNNRLMCVENINDLDYYTSDMNKENEKPLTLTSRRRRRRRRRSNDSS